MDIRFVENLEGGIDTALKILIDAIDEQTVLFLSGGKTPKPLYKKIADYKSLKVGAVAMVDDRYTFHQQYSNEIMIGESGLISYLNSKNIAFYKILKFGLSREKTAEEYDETVRFLLTHFRKSIAVLGIGADGHTAGIPIGTDEKLTENRLVAEFDTFLEDPKDRVTLTYQALSMMDLLLVLVFGEDKKEALKNLPEFYRKEDISKKTILITDQKL
ncbi:MAG TPA: 6-phosphogluconolactonase [Patescibacteria group bacterium]|nr:6-phosphogluconolactonase [Patescibacteria group bacterium]